MNRILKAAKYYTNGLGWRVFPVLGKIPACSHGVKDATRDQEQLEGWWGEEGFGIALACGEPSGVLVVDLDGDAGADSWTKLLHEHEGPGAPNPGPMARTANGAHSYFAWDPNSNIRNSVKRLPGVDVRTTGGYVVLPPSEHPAGGTYQWMTPPWKRPLPNIPTWLEEALASAPRRAPVIKPNAGATVGERVTAYVRHALENCEKRIQEAGPGKRRPTLNAECYRLMQFAYAGALQPIEVRNVILAAARRAGVEEKEIRRIMDAAEEAAARKPELPTLDDTGGQDERRERRSEQQAAATLLAARRSAGSEGGGGEPGRAGRGLDPLPGGGVPEPGDERSDAGDRLDFDRAPEQGSEGATDTGGAGQGGCGSGGGEGTGAGGGGAADAGDSVDTGAGHCDAGDRVAESGRADRGHAHDSGGSQQDPLDLTDVGVAEAIAGRDSSRLAYLPAQDTWLSYNQASGLWEGEGLGGDGAWRAIADFVRANVDTAIEQEQAKRILRLRSTTGITSVIKAMTHERAFWRKPTQFDQHEHLLPTPTGIVDLRSGVLVAAAPELLLSRGTRIAFDPAAEAPLWDAFLEQVTRGDADLRGFLQRAAGYTLTGSIRDQVFFFLHGSGGNGKGTFVRAIQRIMEGFFEKLPETAIVVRRGNQQDRERLAASLPGARFVLADETQHGQLNVAFIKELTGGDTMRARKLYQERDLFFPTAKLWIVGNQLPLPPDVDAAIRRRCLRVRFYYDATRKPDGNLDRKLAGEAEGILAWAVRGAVEWYSTGLRPPSCVRDATDEYLDASDWLADFADACLDFDPEHEATVAEVWATYLQWCDSERRKPAVGQQAGLTNALLPRGVTRARKGKRCTRMVIGVRVRPGLHWTNPEPGRPPTETSDGLPF